MAGQAPGGKEGLDRIGFEKPWPCKSLGFSKTRGSGESDPYPVLFGL